MAAMLERDANASDIARRAGVHTSQLFRWRQQFAAPPEAATFVPVRIAPPDESNPKGENMPQSMASCAAPAMTVIFPSGAHIEFRETPKGAVVAHIVELLAVGGR